MTSQRSLLRSDYYGMNSQKEILSFFTAAAHAEIYVIEKVTGFEYYTSLLLIKYCSTFKYLTK